MTVQGVEGDGRGPRLLRVLLLRAERRTSSTWSAVDDGSGMRQAEHRDDPGRQLQAALPAAVHVPEREGADQAAGRGFLDYVIANYQAIAKSSQIVPMTTDQAAKAKQELANAEQTAG